MAARAKVDEFGTVLVSEAGGFYQSPFMHVANRALEQIRAFGALLGLDPSSRARLRVAPPVEEDSFEALLNAPLRAN